MESVGSETKAGGYFTPLLLSLAGIVATSLVIVAYHVIMTKLCLRRQRRRASTAQSRPMQEGQVGIGVEENVLEAIPIYCYSTENSELQLRVDQSECVICLGELQESDRVRLLPDCGHLFHASCIDDWFSAHTSCPVCRAPIVAPIGTSEVHDRSIGHVEDQSQNSTDQFLGEQGDGDDHNFNASGTSRSSNHSLGHSLSLVLPREGQKAQGSMGLKRSLSMDQSYVIIDIQRERCTDKASSSSCTSNSGTVLIKSGSLGTRSMRQLDRMSSKLLRSFSQLRIGRGASNVILPY
ncbi:unnamed protein product [Dovyalis caffra]|uniref:RING-type E3 ubiquitin transferase n=1 Tax=Dovyalis caffra TaxID=77055 RepID=A0AAV1S3M1_9ROSI|nr:unnamed protein product [Dovyalis caffra]